MTKEKKTKEENREGLIHQVKDQMWEQEEYEKLAELFKMLGDSSRLKILHSLEENELCVGELAELSGISESAVSHQLKSLRLAHLVKNRREAQTIYYSLDDEHVKILVDIGYQHLKERE